MSRAVALASDGGGIISRPAPWDWPTLHVCFGLCGVADGMQPDGSVTAGWDEIVGVESWRPPPAFSNQVREEEARGERISMPSSLSSSTMPPASASLRQMKSGMAPRTTARWLRRSTAEEEHVEINVHDIRVIHKVTLHVTDFRFDESIMVHPEYAITTELVFACRQYPHMAFVSTWITWRAFDEFRVLDHQLRQIPTPTVAPTKPRGPAKKAPSKLNSDEDTGDDDDDEDTDTESPATSTADLFSWWRRSVAAATDDQHPMSAVKPPRLHRRKRWLFQHKTKSFMALRQTELEVYVQGVCATSLRLLHFLDVRAPPYLRYFSNFDAGFGAQLAVTVWNPSLGVVEKDKLDMLESHLLDDASRGLTLCTTYGCGCHFLSLDTSLAAKEPCLAAKHLAIVPWMVPDGSNLLSRSAYMCAVQELYADDDMDLELESLGMLSEKPPSHASPAIAAADKLRRYMSNYGILHAETIAKHVGMSVIDVKKTFHLCKKKTQVRVGAMPLRTLATMLNVTITLVTNDHRHTVRTVFPWTMLTPLVPGPPRHLLWLYLLPTSQYIHGHYRVLRSLAPSAPQHGPAPLAQQDWLLMDELFVRSMAAVVDANEITVMDTPDGAPSEMLQQAILDAVWLACEQNPKRFQSFQWTSKQYGTSRMPGGTFYAFLEKLFRPMGAAYITDFLVHVLPLPLKRQALLRARWARFHSELMVKRASLLHLTNQRRLSLSSSFDSSFIDSSNASTISTSPTEV
ncbi:Aste57867_20558 [Aphanomyces stellatus]|uniref:Aste57867_20558 protein n=1 Tax=Aphanomyces stellatus TaxID=120398 RepID=A0A485LFD2_9STRA|nr:hypothetical protein As57867_020491 [Aphanomyces stellatus]VFT97242.1 Aste57867_20558 [Aphanomyces stellatus]